MGQAAQELKGPDLKMGIIIDSLKSGEKLLGHADGSPVLLIREGENFYAVGAKCSHYGADLNDGMISEGVVHCPWHHACFDMKTGEALKAPALNPIPTWRTEVVSGKVFVREQKKKEHYVIIGSGAAGHAAAERLRTLGFTGNITVLSADSDLPYDRPNLSKDYLAGNAPEEWIPLRSAEFFKEQNIFIRLNSKVIGLDTKNKRIALEQSEYIYYDKCLIATGGNPFKPKISGIDLPHVYFLRSLADSRSLIAGLQRAKKVVIVGAGFIGLEAAAALKARKLDVTIVAPDKVPLERVVGQEVGTFLKSLHESNGVRFHLGQNVEAIEKDKVVLSDKSTVSADLVLVATGIRLAADFAQAAGLRFEDGILVNEYLETSAADVFAAGDIARWPSTFSQDPIRIEHWVVAQRQGQTAAANMLGMKQKYSEVPFFWSQQFDVTLNYIGSAKSYTHVLIDGTLEARDCTVVYFENEKVKAVLTIGRDLENLTIEKALQNQDQQTLKKILS